MSLDENKALMRRWTDGKNRGDPTIVDTCCAPDWAGEVGGPEAVKSYFAAWFAAFPGGTWTIDDTVAEGEKIATMFTFSGINTGEFQGRPPTGKAVTFKSLWIDHVKEGKFVGTPRGMEDRVSWMTDLGMVEPSSMLDQNKALMRQWTDGMNRKDPAVIDETCAPDWGSDLGGYAFWKRLLADWFAGFPDGVWTIDEMIAEGDSVATAYTFAGTHTGEFQGRAPTGKKVTFKGIWIDDMKDGKFVGSPRGMQDRLAWMTELGMVTPS